MIFWSHMAVSIHWESFKQWFKAPGIFGFWIPIRQARADPKRIELLLLLIGGPICGCPYSKGPTIWGLM